MSIFFFGIEWTLLDRNRDLLDEFHIWREVLVSH